MVGNIFKKALVVGIVVLFIGVGAHPAFANEVSIITKFDSEEDCNCEDGYSNILGFSEKYQKLLDFVKLDKSLNPLMSDNCIYLLMKFMNDYYLSIMYTMIGNLLYPQYRNLADKFYRLGDFYFWKAFDTILYAAELGCKWADWLKPEPPPNP